MAPIEWKTLTLTDVEDGRLRVCHWIHNRVIRPHLTVEQIETCNTYGDIVVPVADASQPHQQYNFVYEIRRFPDRRKTPCRDFTDGWVTFRDERSISTRDKLVFYWPLHSNSLLLRLFKSYVPPPLPPASVVLPDDESPNVEEASEESKVEAPVREESSSSTSQSSSDSLDLSLHTIEVLVRILSTASEYDELPVRQNEENHNAKLAEKVPYKVDKNRFDDPHVKANLLFQGLWFDNDSALQMLPCLNNDIISILKSHGISDVQKLLDVPTGTLQNLLGNFPTSRLFQDLQRFPHIHVKLRLKKMGGSDTSSCSLNVRLENSNSKRNSLKAFAPRFPKVRDEGWWIVVGDTLTSELYGLEKVSFADRLVTLIDLPSDPVSGKGMKLIVVSDCYLGYELEYSLDKLLKDQPQESKKVPSSSPE